MNAKIKAHLTKYYQSKGWGNSPLETELIDVLKEANSVWRGEEEEHRWWISYQCVVEIDGMFIGFIDARTTGDENAYDKGFEVDDNTICEMEAKTETVPVTKYVAKSLRAKARGTN